MIMNPADSYEIAFKLAHTLKLYENRFADEDNIIIYPSAWYENFFELMIRDKDDSESSEHGINAPVLNELVGKYLPNGWSYSNVRGECTPLRLQFRYGVK